MKIIYLSILVMGLFFLGCSRTTQLKITKESKQNQYTISTADYSIDKDTIYIRLANKAQGLPFLTDGGYRFQIYIVSKINQNYEFVGTTHAYFISVNSWGMGGLDNGKLKIKKMTFNQKKNYIFIEDAIGKSKSLTDFHLSMEKRVLKRVPLETLREMDIEYDKMCLLNANFSIFSGSHSVNKRCK
jgi:hypothetical protein